MTAEEFSLERWEREFQAGTERLTRLASLSAEAANQSHGGGWSAAQCVEHLDKTAKAMLPLWSGALSAQEIKHNGRYAFWWRWFLKGIENPAKMRSKAPARFEASGKVAWPETLQGYLAARERMALLAKSMSERRAGGGRIVSPFASWMKYPLDFSFDLALAHERRHLKQAEKI